MTREEMLGRFLARDASANGLFLTGVLTTGIYCLPACTARKPLSKNVRFFENEDDAKGAGLRPCRRCRPADFYHDHDPGLEKAESIARRIVREPGEPANLARLSHESGIGATKLNALFHRHFHVSPAALRERARGDLVARELADSNRRVFDIALDAGWESSSAFHDSFRKRTGLSPADYRRMTRGGEISFALPRGFRPADPIAYHGRDPESPSERVAGRTLAKAIRIAAQPVLLQISIGAGRARLDIEAMRPLGPAERSEVFRIGRRLLGLESDPRPFERHLAARPDLAGLIRDRQGLPIPLRIPLLAEPFEALLRAIVGQAISLGSAASVWRRIVGEWGEPSSGLIVPPSAKRLAEAEPGRLSLLGLPARKAAAIVEVSRRHLAGELPLAARPGVTATRVERALLGVPGLGRWSAAYVLLRGFGFADAAPVGDSGLATGLERFFALGHRPDARETESLLAPFAPYRSLATAHFWSLASEAEPDKSEGETFQ